MVHKKVALVDLVDIGKVMAMMHEDLSLAQTGMEAGLVIPVNRDRRVPGFNGHSQPSLLGRVQATERPCL